MLGSYSEKDLEDVEENEEQVATTSAAEDNKTDDGVATDKGDSNSASSTENVATSDNVTEKINTDGPGEKQSTEKKVYSRQEKIDHAFAEIKAKSNRKIQNLEEQIRQLKEEQKNNNLSKDKYKTDEDFYAANAKNAATSVILTDKEDALMAEQKELLRAKNESRFNALYDDENKQNKFKEAWNDGLKNGVIKSIQQDATLGSFLRDSDLNPALVEHFCRKPQALYNILSIENESRKQMELYALETRMKNYLNNKERNTNKVNQQPIQQTKKLLPVLGSQNKAGTNKGNGDDFESADDVFEFIRTH
jgi:hypothetical protein